MLDSSDQLRMVVAKEELNILLQHPGEISIFMKIIFAKINDNYIDLYYFKSALDTGQCFISNKYS